MSKIQKIEITNFKAISDLTVDFKGATAIITAGNNKGKTSLLRGLPDRIRFIRPDVMVKEGATVGKGEMTLTTGEKFTWNFDSKGKDTLHYTTEKGIKTSVSKELGAQFFPPTFDIDRFMQSGPKDQAKQLQKILGIDFTDIDSRYAIEYTNRTAANKEVDRLQAKLDVTPKAEQVSAVDLTELSQKKEVEKKRLNDLYLENKTTNATTKNTWLSACAVIDSECAAHNEAQTKLIQKYNRCYDAVSILKSEGYDGLECDMFLDATKRDMKPLKSAKDIYQAEPEYIQEMPDRTTLDEIDADILTASTTNQKAQEYDNYMKLVNEVGEAKAMADAKDVAVKDIEAERKALIESAKFPQGITITPDGIMVDGLPLDKNQLSTSKLYTTALRIASMNLGEVKTLYFDASFLDRDSLAEIEAWAATNDLQLLIERVGFEGGDITYELIES